MDINTGLLYALAITNTLVFGARLPFAAQLRKIFGEEFVKHFPEMTKNITLCIVMSFIMTGVTVIIVGCIITLKWGTQSTMTVALLCVPTAANWIAANWMSKMEEQIWSSMTVAMTNIVNKAEKKDGTF